MFLKAVGKKSGAILGESIDPSFPEQIEIADWSWGMSMPGSMESGPTGKRQLKELVFSKKADRSSTALMVVASKNEELKEVLLSVRKAGGVALPYWVLKLTDARISKFDVESSIDSDGAPILRERIALSFKTISIEFTVQNAKGAAVSSSEFNDDVSMGAY